MRKHMWTRGGGLKLYSEPITLMKCTNIQHTDYYSIYGLYNRLPMPMLILIDSIRDLLVYKYELY